MSESATVARDLSVHLDACRVQVMILFNACRTDRGVDCCACVLIAATRFID